MRWKKSSINFQKYAITSEIMLGNKNYALNNLIRNFQKIALITKESANS